MKKISLVLLMSAGSILSGFAQETTAWTEADRKYLVDNLIRSRDELLKATAGLSEKQWNFKESPDRWSINEVVEHINLWELLFQHEMSRSFQAGAQPERIKTAEPDSYFLDFIMEEKPHHSAEYTKPFTYTIPMNLNSLKSNASWFSKMRNESVEYVKSSHDDLRLYFNSYGSIHQIYINVFGHTDRHLRQIKKIKQHPNYPKK